jgi:hypothetical protein
MLSIIRRPSNANGQLASKTLVVYAAGQIEATFV